MRSRDLSEVRAAGQEAWFAPALELIQSDLGRSYFQSGEPLYVARAPGRLDVMGGIADYSGSLVLELPLACSTAVALQRTSDAEIEVCSRRDGTWHRFRCPVELLEVETVALAAWFAARQRDHWAAYVVGCIRQCGIRNSGLRILIDSTVPEGKGVSSSAALEVATMYAVAAAFDLDLGCEQLALACQQVENHVVGAPCGVMDQMTSACGRDNRLLALRCQPAVIEGYIEMPKNFRFYGIDSGVRHAVTGSDYTTVRTAAFMGHRIISDMTGWPTYLAQLSVTDFAESLEQILPEQMTGTAFLEQFGGIADSVTRVRADHTYPVRAATAHPVYENDRVERFAHLLQTLEDEPGCAHALGQLMYESHASYSACGLGSDGTDRLVELVRNAAQQQGLFGAKITGGGSGGTVAILGTTAAEPAVRAIAERYDDETGRHSTVFSHSGPSASETGVLLCRS